MSMWWELGAAANAVIAIAYFGIVWAIVRPLLKSGQLRSNPLGAATAAIFLSCAVHHGGHVVHMLLPVFFDGQTTGLAWRQAYDLPTALWDLVGAAIGVYYWTLRRTYGSLMQGAQLFEDMRARERQALELHDAVLQGMVVAKMALDLDELEQARSALEASIESASRMISDLLGPANVTEEQRLLRSKAATLSSPLTAPGSDASSRLDAL
jgi:signal transduction histidine kinase